MRLVYYLEHLIARFPKRLSEKLIECEITGLPFMPSSKKDLHISFVAKFWSKVDRSRDKNECWPWTGFIEKDGYGVYSQRGSEIKTYFAHRISYLLTHFPKDYIEKQGKMKGKEVHHLCGSNSCCNPYHLQLVTARLHRGIHSQLPHEKIDRQRLFREILKDWKSCDDLYKLIDKYELPQKLIENIILKKTKAEDLL